MDILSPTPPRNECRCNTLDLKEVMKCLLLMARILFSSHARPRHDRLDAFSIKAAGSLLDDVCWMSEEWLVVKDT
jgi:hypothetical protein